MQPTVTLVRAVGVEFARRIIRPLVVVGVVAAIVVLALGGWLTTRSVWWWLLEAVFIAGALLFVLIVTVVHIILRLLAPSLSRHQKREVGAFVDKLERVAETIKTPQVVVIYYVIRDIIRPRDNSFIATISKDSKTLAPDLIKLRKELDNTAA